MSDIRIVLVEDHDLTRVGLRTALQRSPGIQVVGEASNAIQGLKVLQELQPDVAIVDIGLPDGDGIELTHQLKQFQADRKEGATKVLILTMHDSESSVLAAFAAGADSYCMKDVSIDKLIEAVHSTDEGHAWIDPIVANVVLKCVRRSSHSPIYQRKTVEIGAVEPEVEHLLEGSPLTRRELEILQLVVQGYSNNAIAQELFISLGTVKTHVRNILNKLHADDRTQAAVLALRSGLVS